MDTHTDRRTTRSSADVEDALNRYQDTVYRIALTYCKNSHDAKDVTQDVFLKYLQSSVDYASDEHTKAWLIRVTINQCKKLVTSPWFQRTQPLEDSVPLTERSHSELYQAVMRLPKYQRVAIHLYYYEDYSTKEVAEALGKNESTVRSYLHRARKRLKILLEEGIFDE